MSLVDYASDEDEDVMDASEEDAVPGPAVQTSDRGFSVSAAVPFNSDSVIDRQSQGGVSVQSPSTRSGPSAQIRLPDVADLLGPSAEDGATTSGTQRKRMPAANGSAHPMPNRKLPRGNLRPSRLPPDTAGGLLTPPQLRGRSNVATEDLDKIFTRRQTRR